MRVGPAAATSAMLIEAGATFRRSMISPLDLALGLGENRQVIVAATCTSDTDARLAESR